MGVRLGNCINQSAEGIDMMTWLGRLGLAFGQDARGSVALLLTVGACGIEMNLLASGNSSCVFRTFVKNSFDLELDIMGLKNNYYC